MDRRTEGQKNNMKKRQGKNQKNELHERRKEGLKDCETEGKNSIRMKEQNTDGLTYLGVRLRKNISDHAKINSIGGLKNTGFSVHRVKAGYLVRLGKNATSDHVKVDYLSGLKDTGFSVH